MKLTKLPNGNWVDMATVTAIRILPTEKCESGTLHRARLILHHGTHGLEILMADDDDHAATMADEFAGITNQEPRQA